MPDAQPQQISALVWMLQSGGLTLLALGLLLALVGIVLVFQPSRKGSEMLIFLSLLPGMIGMVLVYSAAADYVEMAASPVTPKPAELAQITGRAMSNSFCGLLATILPVFIAAMAISRTRKSADVSAASDAC